ncbi:glycosyltransferase family 2 protein [Acetobacteraceae bacterium ESL0709]|nr:glycosyltransferase family 2 protein [Acetobacteraceae bacterium ESL0697]MDF7679013.1 glycosyltransferase family 2 protein [Acetobacteraceae bacterium ESL0709]
MYNCNKVSIILRTKNREFFFRRAVKSILNQTYKGYHVYIVNDGGCVDYIKNSMSLLMGHERSKFSIIDLPKSTRRGGALSIGINSSFEEYIHVHDDDDTLEPEFLEKMVSYLDNDKNEIYSAVICSNYDVYETCVDGIYREVERSDRNGQRTGSVMDYGLYLSGLTAIVPIALLFRRKFIRLSGGANPCLDYGEDTDLFKRLLLYGDVGIVNDFLCSYCWPVSLDDDGRTTLDSRSKRECDYQNIMYDNVCIREAMFGNSILKDLQVELIKHRLMGNHQSSILLQNLTLLEESFFKMIEAINNLLEQKNHR